MMAEYGANVFVAETGTIPRDSEIQTSEWNNYTISDEQLWLQESGYQLWEDHDEKTR